MQNSLSKGNLLQLLIILIGLPLGAYLSNRSALLHERLEHNIPIIHKAMDHGFLDVSGDEIVPTIDAVKLSKDKMAGWNITIVTSDFTFTPANVNEVHVPGQGHAHLYINDEKYARLYSPSFHIPQLAGGSHKLTITLNANDHQTLSINDQAIEKILIIE